MKRLLIINVVVCFFAVNMFAKAPLPPTPPTPASVNFIQHVDNHQKLDALMIKMNEKMKLTYDEQVAIQELLVMYTDRIMIIKSAVSIDNSNSLNDLNSNFSANLKNMISDANYQLFESLKPELLNSVENAK
jgi:hypothetical protein